jgi:hypothetical protein
MPEIHASATLMEGGGDATTSVLLIFRAQSGLLKSDVHCLSTASLRSSDDNAPSVRIQCAKGEVQLFGKAPQPSGFKVIFKDPNEKAKEFKFNELPGVRGMYHEADECARCIRDGKLQSDIMPLDDSVAMMTVMDTIRKQCNITYPAEIESTSLPAGY